MTADTRRIRATPPGDSDRRGLRSPREMGGPVVYGLEKKPPLARPREGKIGGLPTYSEPYPPPTRTRARGENAGLS